MKVKSEMEVAQSCPTLRDPMGCSPPGSSIHVIFQARVLEWGAIAFSDQMPRSIKSGEWSPKISIFFVSPDDSYVQLGSTPLVHPFQKAIA